MTQATDIMFDPAGASDTAQGKVEMIIKQEDGKVIQRFRRPMEVIVYEPKNAVDVARAITDAAFLADTKLKPVGETLKAEIVQRHRETLIPRVALMLGSLREDRLKSNGQIAVTIVDALCSEVFS